MKNGWIIGIIIIGVLIIGLQGRGVNLQLPSFFSPSGSFGITHSQSEENGSYILDRNRDGIIDAEERKIGEIQRIQSELDDIQDAVIQATEAKLESKYKGLIYFDGDNIGAQDEDEEYITIAASSRLDQNVLITGWKLISSVSGRQATIGTAALIPKVGQVNTTAPIIIAPGEEIVVSSGLLGIGVSFRTNACTGYFEQYQDFEPPLDIECPLLSDESLITLGITKERLGEDEYYECIDHLEQLPRCEISRMSIYVERECNLAIRKYTNYNACVSLHEYDADFLKNEWRVFLNANRPLWRENREIIKLVDNEGKIVDILSY